MTFGITGNTNKQLLWDPVMRAVDWFEQSRLAFKLYEPLAKGLVERGRISALLAEQVATMSLHETDMVLSFGGDGTIINTARLIAPHGTPVLGVNIGRLGFLADMEVSHIELALEKIRLGQYKVMPRMALELLLPQDTTPRWALNEFVINKGPDASLININAHINGVHLCNYWADGLIVATPTGSTAYSLSAGGAIMVPGSACFSLTPLAAHTLTMRPLVVPHTAVLELNIPESDCPYMLVVDGEVEHLGASSNRLILHEAKHTFNLVILEGHDYFATLRGKLGWGVHVRA
ncbi:MAG: NAD(+)/NADH kinase [Bacteroidetes Order II. Incertae sedis bacterium]|nr:NAD(+)/NADH kinase [Bacteroidetes Order II. bacterium]